MSKELVEITGFRELQAKIKKLGNDKDKRRTMLKILRKSAKSTIDAARRLSPKDTKVGSKSIKFQVMRRAAVPMGIVGPRSTGKYDGWYMRQFVIPGHNIYKGGFKRNRRGNKKANALGAKSKVPANFFMNKAQDATRGKVIGKAVPQTEKYFQKLINQL